MRYDYDICYKKGKDNIAADALSRIHSNELVALSVSSISSDLLNEIQESWERGEITASDISAETTSFTSFSVYLGKQSAYKERETSGGKG